MRRINVTRHKVIMTEPETDQDVLLASTDDIAGAPRHHLVRRDGRVVIASHDEAGNEVHAIDAADALAFLEQAPAEVRNRAVKMVVEGYHPAERSIAKLLEMKAKIAAFDRPARDGRVLDNRLAAAPVSDWHDQTRDWTRDAAELFKEIEPLLDGEKTDYLSIDRLSEHDRIGMPTRGNDPFGADQVTRAKFNAFCIGHRQFHKLLQRALAKIDLRLAEAAKLAQQPSD
jgi:hypothetical protein